MPDSIDPAERKKTMTLLEQYVTVSMQGERIDEAELMERLRMFNAIAETPAGGVRPRDGRASSGRTARDRRRSRLRDHLARLRAVAGGPQAGHRLG